MKYKLKEIGNVITGKTPSTKKSKYFSNKKDKFLFITPRDMNNDRKYIEKTERFLTSEVEKNFKKNILMPNSVCVSCIGSDMGKVYMNKSIAITNQQINSITNIKPFCNAEYLYYYLKPKKDFLKNLSSGSTMPILNKTDFENLIIDLPDIKIQDKIVAILSRIDNKIDSNNQINDNLHNLCEEQFRQLYNNGKDNELSSLLCSIQTGSRPKGGAERDGIPSIGAEKIEKFGVYDYSSEKYISEEYFQNLKKGIINSGDVLLYKDGAYTGKVSMALDDFPHKQCAINEHVFKLNTEKNQYQYYLYFCLYIKENRKKLETMASSKAAQPGLNQEELKNIKIKLPQPSEMIEFENQVSPLMHMIALNAKSNRKLVNLRDTLLPKLMNGEIDLDKVEI